MKTESTTQKAEGLGNAQGEIPKFKGQTPIQETNASEEEFLEQLREYLRTARKHSSPALKSIARDWERAIEYRIRVTLQARERRAAARAKREAMRMQMGGATR